MNDSNINQNGYTWNAGDYSNIITIGSAALASVLLVIFKSRCQKISICFGLLSCDRKLTQEDKEEENENENENENNNNNNLVPPNNNP